MRREGDCQIKYDTYTKECEKWRKREKEGEEKRRERGREINRKRNI